MALWNGIFWLMVIFFGLLMLNRWVTNHVQGLGLLLSNSRPTSVWLYFFLFLPGIFLHELSHYLIALVLRVRVSGFSLWPKVKKNGELILGSVQVRGAGPLRHSLIGVAPFLFGCAAVLWIGQTLNLDSLAQALTDGNLALALNTIGGSFSAPDFWLWLYLLFAIANAMFPSASDRIYWIPVLAFVGTLLLLGIGFDVIPVLPASVRDFLANFIGMMASALGIALLVDVFFVGLLFSLETVVGALTRRKIQY